MTISHEVRELKRPAPVTGWRWGLPYQVRRIPITLLFMLGWGLLGLILYRNPFPVEMYPAVVDPSNRSDAHFWIGAVMMVTSVVMIIGALASWTRVWGAITLIAGLGFAALEGALWIISVGPTLFTGTYLWPEIAIALTIWIVVTGGLLIAVFTTWDLIMKNVTRYE